jgi:hypothetical protein
MGPGSPLITDYFWEESEKAKEKKKKINLNISSSFEAMKSFSETNLTDVQSQKGGNNFHDKISSSERMKKKIMVKNGQQKSTILLTHKDDLVLSRSTGSTRQ